MAKTKAQQLCENCGFDADDVGRRTRSRPTVTGDRLLCGVCTESMPGVYAVGGSSEHSIPAAVMRQISFCTNLILREVRRLHNTGRDSRSMRTAHRSTKQKRG